MNYQGQLQTGEEILLQNDDQQTRIQLKSGDKAKRETQGTSFETGKWSKIPALYELKKEAFLEIQTEKASVFLKITEGGIERLDEKPNLNDAKSIELQETDEAPAHIEMKPMEPLKPMKPMGNFKS